MYVDIVYTLIYVPDDCVVFAEDLNRVVSKFRRRRAARTAAVRCRAVYYPPTKYLFIRNRSNRATLRDLNYCTVAVYLRCVFLYNIISIIICSKIVL